ncbi:flavin-containing monooxygenase [Nodularia spumigena]|uniref:flavin-containing monooxygenase n=1 Tax=Nodularia spumigena TaxID=70799 RepID=UPI00232E9319|nr:NAD(P)-binding domain-containing protein [Nodularia spumigena]MDB9316642.1 NAD(P)-binding domain-containing protein [Nodularia spumigena CS-590/01A]MDB9326174.1 NAD(P)-binding domain-containing protein [Nodularia spumigena CS-590/02]
MVNVSNSSKIQNMVDKSDKHLIIGAGFVGLGMAQALKAADIPYDQVDASDNIGGNWYHGVYETAHIISSRKITQFTHFPMPDHYPDFPSAQNMLDYLNSFADHFDLRGQIELNRTISYVRPVENNLWEVTFADGEQRIYKGVVMCNGHHWRKRFPEFQGEFNGEIIHSKDYKHPDQLRGKRVLVIGGGNSACDLAAEAARVSAKSVLSMRESVWFIPKTFAGVPSVDFLKWWMPQWFQRLMAYIIIRLSFGTHKDYGLSEPNHRIFDKHPTVNNEVPYYIKHGRIIPKPAVRQLDGWEVEFVDGSREAFDLIVCATGYYVAYPFLPPELQRVEGAVVKCYGGSFLADYKGLYFVGWGQARGGVGSLISAYGSLFTSHLQLQNKINVPIGLVFKEVGQKLPTTNLSDPQQIFQQIKLANFSFNWLVKKAHQIDAQHPNFSNQPLPTRQSREPVQSLVR